MIHKPFHFVAMFLVGAICMIATAQDEAKKDTAAVEKDVDDTAKVEAAIQSYVAAFNARDVEKLVAHWSPEGVYTSRTSGEQIVGRKAMTEEFTLTFKGESVPTLAVETESIDFISPNVALERGKAIVTRAENDVFESNYSVVYMKRDGAWLIDRVTEDEIIIEETHYDKLKDLEWLVGDWQHQGAGFRIEVSCQWTTKQNFISRRFKVFAGDDEVESSGLQVIGWDAKNKEIRSWLFDSDGGVVTGTWNKRDDRWVVQSVATLADGGSGSFSSIFRPIEDGSYGWEKINRVLDGKILPNIDEIIVQRN